MPRTAKNPLPTKFFDLKGVEFRVIFGAKEFVRLTPTNDDKPKSAEIMPLKAGSDYSCLLTSVKPDPTGRALLLKHYSSFTVNTSESVLAVPSTVTLTK